MTGRQKYFLFNKESDFRRGYLQDMVVCDGGVCPEEGSGKKGIFLSRLLDSGQAGMDWHRLRLKGRQSDQSSFRLSIYATDEREIGYEGRLWDLDEFIRSDGIDIGKKLETVEPLRRLQAVGTDDLILHDVQGRYLFLLLEMYRQHDMQNIRDIQIFFPRQSWRDYLPEIYAKYDEDGFLDRFLCIFESLQDDLREEIAATTGRFDRDSGVREYLDWLAEWIGIRDSYIWSDEQLRTLIRDGISLYKKRGTRAGIIELLTLYTGEEPYIVEHHQIADFKDNKEQAEMMRRLYGNRPDFFTVLIKEERIDSPWKKKTVMRLVDSFKPAHMDWQLIVIRPYTFVGEYTYLGVNTVLGSYSGLKLDGHSAMSLSILEGGEA